MIDTGRGNLSSLSEREREVLGGLAAGHTYREIARYLELSVHTVDTYARRIRAKTGVTDRMQLAGLAHDAAASGPEKP